MPGSLQPVSYARVLVFFAKPLAADVRVFNERWTARLAKAFGLFPGGDIQTDHPTFDRLFIVQGADRERVLAALPRSFLDAMVAFARKRPRIFSEAGSIQVSCRQICYLEGPYAAKGMKGLVARSEPLVKDLLALASSLPAPA